MTIHHDDPRLTAYALGELEGEEAKALEALLAEDPAALLEVEALRQLGGRLETELADAPAPLLQNEDRIRLTAAAERPARWPWIAVLGAAAAVLAVFGVGALLSTEGRGGSHGGSGLESARLSGSDVNETEDGEEGLDVAGKAASDPQNRTGLEELRPGEAWARVQVPGEPTSGPPADLSGFSLPRATLRVSAERDRIKRIDATPANPTHFGFEESEPVIKDAEFADHLETDVDLPSAGPVFKLPVGVGGGAGGTVVLKPGDTLARIAERAYGSTEAFHGAPVTLPHVVLPPTPTPAPVTPGSESYDAVEDNEFVRVLVHDDATSTSTFSIDVDTASYANVRRFLTQMNRLPPKDAVRIEELVNYFPYDYAPPRAGSEHPFAFHAAAAACPWAPEHRLVRVALKGEVMTAEERPAANLVFLLDVSGSMQPANKLPLVKQALRMLIESLRPDDKVAIVVYAGAAGMVLPSTSGADQAAIHGALDRLGAGGSTNGGAGIELAYALAAESFVEGGVNRVVLCTDGDFNCGVSDRSSLATMIEQKAKTGVFLSVLGFGMGNVKDGFMEELSNKGNGNYGYVDTLDEAQKLLVDEGLGTLVTIAKDVKIQVFFNPAKVAGWRLIGYENRILAREDFHDDTKDAGEIGAGHTVTALYEIVPAGVSLSGPRIDPNPFVTHPTPPSTESSSDDTSDALLRLRLRYKQPDEDTSTLLEQDLFDAGSTFDLLDDDFQHAAAVAGFGMLLRDSPHKGQCSWALVEEIAQGAAGDDVTGLRAGFLDLVRKAASLSPR